jgi:hypothetical protein
VLISRLKSAQRGRVKVISARYLSWQFTSTLPVVAFSFTLRPGSNAAGLGELTRILGEGSVNSGVSP